MTKFQLPNVQNDENWKGITKSNRIKIQYLKPKLHKKLHCFLWKRFSIEN